MALAEYCARLQKRENICSKPKRLKNLRAHVREAFASKKELVFLDFITDQTENVYPMIPGGKGMTEMILSEEL